MRVFDVILKDLKILLRDRKALGIMILMPIILSTILSFALSGSFGSGNDTNRIKIAIVKNYKTDENVERFESLLKGDQFSQYLDSKQVEELLISSKNIDIEKIFFNDFLDDEDIQKIIEYSIVGEEKAKGLLDNKDISAAVLLPETFIYDMNVNFFTPLRNKVDVKIIGHPDRPISSQIVEGIMNGFFDMASSMVISKNVFLETVMEAGADSRAYEDVSSIFDSMLKNKNEQLVEIYYEKTNEKPPITSAQYYSIGIAVMFILYAAGHGGRLLLQEKQDKTYQRMTVTGTAKWKIVTGKFFTILIIALIQIITLLIYSSTILNVDWGNISHVALSSICSAFAVAGLGIMLASISFASENYKVANIVESVVFQIMAMLGGSYIPIQVMPELLQKIGKFTLNGLALKAYLNISTGGSLVDIASTLVSLIMTGIIFTLVAIYILSKEGGIRNVKHNQIKTAKSA